MSGAHWRHGDSNDGQHHSFERRSQQPSDPAADDDEQGVIQNRLATGKKVNSAIDNPVNYFTSLNLNDRASQLNGLLDGISNGIQTIQAASKGIDAITKLVQSRSRPSSRLRPTAASRPTETSTSSIGGANTVTSAGVLKHDPEGRHPRRDPGRSGGSSGHHGTGSPAARRQRRCLRHHHHGGQQHLHDATLTATSTVQIVVDSINKSGIATATVGG